MAPFEVYVQLCCCCNNVSGQFFVSEFRNVEEHLFGRHKLFKLQLHWCTETATRVKPAKTASFRTPRHGLHLARLCLSFSLFISLLIICRPSRSLFCCRKPCSADTFALLIQAHILMLFRALRHREITRASK